MNPISFLADIMLEALKFFAVFTGGNYGLAIVLLTVVINLALYPLTLSSIVQMSAMQKIQPKIKELQEKHKGKPDVLQKETMALYKQEKVNPVGGCLPMLLKIPFFISLFFALQSSGFAKIVAGEGTKAGFLWMPSLVAPDPTYIMVALIGITTYFSQKTMPTAETSQTKMMAMFMPIFIAFISMRFFAGVQIYWAVSSAVAIAQQVYIMRVKV
ncbi:MAG: YidC/Oxa1 family membrane protein insertase [Candidatus Margulisbacteria bacterium]|nr:YidC/Oxa1 family membrane protein insertase [Candidatus Margulisiibacteriota bacterium]MBU1021985.1 YidC/Oxa1 family membrane protein insertase [Candidatus Margulisiibacteriota bacterium]MBU1728963.1 YidC/Oxa1 family membrane protein insertase [Candidatus Margulisiibacteriota bacterium]MBU1954769.1 YidC/Oxa1 family membrane protein insertase [Candidatus Margulisiibacteriota bacterium]